MPTDFSNLDKNLKVEGGRLVSKDASGRPYVVTRLHSDPDVRARQLAEAKNQIREQARSGQREFIEKAEKRLEAERRSKENSMRSDFDARSSSAHDAIKSRSGSRVFISRG